MRRPSLVPILFACLSPACSDSPGGKPMPDMTPRVDPFKPVPECMPGSLLVKPLQGDRQMLISSLRIADFCEGFDLNGDGKVDNKLAPVGALANSQILGAFQFDHTLVVPIELFGYAGKDSECTKFAFYLGRLNEDRDHDGHDTTWAVGKSDCDDTDPAVHPGQPQSAMHRYDDDCDGFAMNPTPSVAPTGGDQFDKDLDGDGQSPAQGDCDDRPGSDVAKHRYKGAPEICGNGIDDDCDGIADNGDKCDPFKDNKLPVHVTAQSFSQFATDGGVPSATDGGVLDPTGLTPFIVFPDGHVRQSMLEAGPDLFQLSVPLDKSSDISLTINGVHIRMHLDDKPIGAYADPSGAKDPDPKCASKDAPGGLLGGVLEAVTLAQIKHLNIGGFLKGEQSLLDAVFVGGLASVIGLESDQAGHNIPDIDVDGDGIESFWQEQASTGPKMIDTCRDGDGTIVHNNFDGKGTPCVLARDARGNYRFLDGISVALKFNAVPVKITDVVEK